MRPRIRVSGWLSTLLIACCCCIALPVAAFAASVSTHKAVYVPGERVVIHGQGWRSGESVSLAVTPGDASTLQATADANGEFTNSQYTAEAEQVGQEVTLTATGTASGSATTIFANAAANLDQGGNEEADNPTNPVDWVNGNLNPENSHFVEGNSIPYRMVMTNLTNGSHELIIGWDTKDGNLAALDYLTHYQRLQPHNQFVPAHSAETVDPLLGLGGGFGAPSTYAIDPPSTAGTPVAGMPASSFNALPANERVLTIWNGTITGAVYTSQDPLNLAHAQSEMKITFTSTAPTVVIAWGGHIGVVEEWNGLAHPGGSPYHMRNVSLDGQGGNQDRSLKADAVFSCEIAGPTPCVGTTNQYCVTTNIGGTKTYAWEFTANTSGASFVGATNGACVDVNAGNTAGYYSLKVTVTGADGGITCEHTFTVNGGPTCSITGPDGPVCPSSTQEFCGPPGLASYSWSVTGATIQGAANGQCVTIVAPTGCNTSYTVNLTVADATACPSTCSKTVNVSDTTLPVIAGVGPGGTIECPATPAFSEPTASDNCGAASLDYVDVRTNGDCPAEYSVTRTWTATDACGNQATASQTIDVVDTTAPVISNVPADATVECSSIPPPPENVVASDACDANVPIELLAESITILDSSPSATACTYEINRTWKATDDCGNAATASQKLTVHDTTAPTVVSCPADETIECPATPSFGTPQFADNCDAELTITFNDVETPSQTCPNAKDVTRTWTAKDNCDLSVTCSQTIHIVDTTAPVLTCPGNITVGECQNTVTYTGSGEDACGGQVAIVFDPPSGTVFGVGTTTVTMTGTDVCGNSSTCEFTVTVTGSPVAAITGEDAVCDGQTAELCGPDGNFSWAWTGPGSFSADTRCINVGVAGTYNLVVTDLGNGCTANGSHELTVNPNPVCSITGPAETCEGTSVELCGPDGNYGYAWNGPGGFTADTRCITVSAAGDYSLVVTDLATKCESASCSHTLATTPCVANCPRTAGFWAAQCDQAPTGQTKFDLAAMTAITSCVDDKVGIFNWAAGQDFSRFCATVGTGGQMDQRRQAKRQFSAFLAN
ncbi:MAG TPA: HYR domain-containing protein, partial [Candidatus Eisenbacteria bacterium]|nr:HYR domain-containing protein [Candidatus Eisenbacteria bacterium]